MSPDLAYVSATLKGAVRKMSPDQREVALDCFEHYRGECQRIAGDDPLRVAFTVHEMIDEHMRHMIATSKHGPHITCRKGCGACCHLNVDVFPQEAVLLRAVAREAGVDIDEARLARQLDHQGDKWHELPIEDRRCVFLGENRACRVYEHRPGSCRKYAVKSDPDRCDMVKYPGGQVAIVFSAEAEIIHSAAMTVYGSGSMAAMLLSVPKE